MPTHKYLIFTHSKIIYYILLLGILDIHIIVICIYYNVRKINFTCHSWLFYFKNYDFINEYYNMY